MLKVLLVDDDLNFIRCLNQLIDWDTLGLEVIGESYDGQQAYEMAIEKKPDIIISDVRMPMMSGTDLCKKIRGIMDDVSIIFLSAYEDFNTAQLAIRYNVNEYILKPMTSHKIQVLRNRLDSLSKNYNNRNYYSSLLHNSDIEKDILCHLKTADEDYIIEFFNKFTNCIAGNFDIVREACLKMLSILFDYFISIGLDRSSIERKKDAVKTDFNGLKRKRDMVIYVSQLYFNLFQPGEAEGKHSYYHTLISSIKSYIKDNCCDTMFSVTRVADEFNFSEDYIGKLFKQYTDITISNYIAVVRLENAVNLLVNTVDSIKDISGTLGYGSPQYFAQVFKEKYHMTPTEYRIRMQRISKRVIDRLR